MTAGGSPRGTALRTLPAVEDARRAYGSVFGAGEKPSLAAAPGRVNLIGEHVDYNDGYVLPAAIDRYVTAAFARNGARLLRVHAVSFGETRVAPLDALEEARGAGWLSYVAGVAWALADAGVPLVGVDLAIASDLPLSAGLSSSAAIELVTARALMAAAGAAWDPTTAALRCQRAENEFVGVNCGIMDQFAVALGVEAHGILLDCRSLETTPVPLPAGARIVVMDTAAPRDLAATGYNERRAACEAAVAALRTLAPQVRSLRDVDGALLDQGRHLMDPTVFRRAQHVVAEIPRPLDTVEALGAGDLERCGRLLNDSHWSLRDLYEVSCPELDAMTALARQHPACYGARLTGAGFGGSAVALVAADGATAFVVDVQAEYRARTGMPGTLHLCRAVGGVALV